jgi:hypothetical protein
MITSANAAAGVQKWERPRIGPCGFNTGIAIKPGGGEISWRTDVLGAYYATDTGVEKTQIIRPSAFPAANFFPLKGGIQGGAGVYAMAYAYPPSNRCAIVWDGLVWISENGMGGPFTVTTLAQRTDLLTNAAGTRGMENRLVFDPVDAATLYLAGPAGVWQCVNAGAGASASFTLLTAFPAVNTTNIADIAYRSIQLVVDPNSATVGGRKQGLYAGITGQGVYASTDAGATAAAVSGSPLYPVDMEIDTTGRLYLAARGEYTNTVPGAYSDAGSEAAYWRYDAGGSMTNIGRFGFNRAIHISVSPLDNNDLVISSGDGGMRWSTDRLATTTGSQAAVDGEQRMIAYARPVTAHEINYAMRNAPIASQSMAKPRFNAGADKILIAGGYTPNWVDTADWFAQPNGAGMLTFHEDGEGMEELVGQRPKFLPQGRLALTTQDRTIVILEPSPGPGQKRPLPRNMPITGVLGQGWNTSFHPSAPHYHAFCATVASSRYEIWESFDYGRDGTWQLLFTRSGNTSGSVAVMGERKLVAILSNAAPRVWTGTATPAICKAGGVDMVDADFLATNNNWHVGGINGPRTIRVVADPVTPGLCYFYYYVNGAPFPRGFYRSTDGGVDFTQRNSTQIADPVNGVAFQTNILCTQQGRLILCNGHLGGGDWLQTVTGSNLNRLMYSDDQGVVWSEYANIRQVHDVALGKAFSGSAFQTICFMGHYDVAGTYTWGFWKSHDGLATVLPVNGPTDLCDRPFAIDMDPEEYMHLAVSLGGSALLESRYESDVLFA